MPGFWESYAMNAMASAYAREQVGSIACVGIVLGALYGTSIIYGLGIEQFSSLFFLLAALLQAIRVPYRFANAFQGVGAAACIFAVMVPDQYRVVDDTVVSLLGGIVAGLTARNDIASWGGSVLYFLVVRLCAPYLLSSGVFIGGSAGLTIALFGLLLSTYFWAVVFDRK